MRALLSSVALSMTVGCTPAFATVPIGDGKKLTSFVTQLDNIIRDRAAQNSIHDRSLRNLFLNNQKAGTKLQELNGTIGTRPVQENLLQSNAYRENPYAVETSLSADKLFGVPKPSLEAKIIKAAMNFKDSEGVRRVGLDPLTWRIMFQSLIKAESAFNTTAKSQVGAYGLGQLMPETAKGLGVNRYIVEENLRGAAKYITTQLKAFGNIDHALAAYNAGPGNVRKYGGIPPFKETQNYVVRIRGHMREYITLYGGHLPDATFGGSLMSAGEYGFRSDALANYADHILAETLKSVARLTEIKNRIDNSPDLQHSQKLKTSATTESQKLQTLLLRLRAAKMEAQSAYQMALAQNQSEARDYWDWTYK